VRSQYGFFLSVITVLLFIIVLPIYACSGCDLRKRSEKAACRGGNGDVCLAVGKYYEAKADGILGFAMSNGATAAGFYNLGCKNGSLASCERLGNIMFNGYDSAKDDHLSQADGLRAYAKACLGKLAEACDGIDEAYKAPYEAEEVADVTSRYFLDACKAKDARGCFEFAKFVRTSHGEQNADPDLAKQYFGKACDLGDMEGCAKAR
jgi:TPR repeat protein